MHSFCNLLYLLSTRAFWDMDICIHHLLCLFCSLWWLKAIWSGCFFFFFLRIYIINWGAHLSSGCDPFTYGGGKKVLLVLLCFTSVLRCFQDAAVYLLMARTSILQGQEIVMQKQSFLRHFLSAAGTKNYKHHAQLGKKKRTNFQFQVLFVLLLLFFLFCIIIPVLNRWALWSTCRC